MTSADSHPGDVHAVTGQGGDGHRHGGGSGHSHLPDAGADRRYLLLALGLLAASGPAATAMQAACGEANGA